MQNENAKKRQASLLSPLILAYMGDAVYEQYVRGELIRRYSKESPHSLHTRATHIVRSSAQAATAAAIYEDLTEQERTIYRRGRNANTSTVPKNADVAQYRMATGFEAVIGYLFLGEEDERLQQVLELSSNKGWKEGNKT